MKPLIANFKHLYQYRSIWIYYLLWIAAISFLFETMIAMDTSEDSFLPPLILFGLWGERIAETIAGTSNKPFAFCLPNHAQEIKKLLFTIWLLMTIICFLILPILYLFSIHIDRSLFIGFIGLMSLSFWLGTSVFIRKIKFLFLSFLILAVSFMFSGNMETTILSVIADHPWLMVFSSGILSYSIYHAIGSRANQRRLYMLPWRGPAAGSKSRQRLINQEWMRQNKKTTVSKAAELFGNYFTTHIKSSCYSKRLPYLWGQVYLTIKPIFSHWKSIGVVFFGSYFCLVFFPCFIEELHGAELFILRGIVFIVISFYFSTLFIKPRFNTFLLSGRNVLFFQGVVILFIVISLTLGFSGASTLLFKLLSTDNSEIILSGKSYAVVPIPWILQVIPLIMVPLFGGLFVLFRGIKIVMAIFIMFFFTIFVSFPTITTMENASIIVNLMIVLFASAITWGFHLVALYYTSMKRSLY